MSKLSDIQKALICKKSNTNDFGKYKYRNCEDILGEVKPLLGSAVLVIRDEVVMIGDRYYVKATVDFRDGEELAVTTAYAREAEEKKGMDVAQVTGAASSYARKYALCGMFCIDNNKDPDMQDNREAPKNKTSKKTEEDRCPF